MGPISPRREEAAATGVTPWMPPAEEPEEAAPAEPVAESDSVPEAPAEAPPEAAPEPEPTSAPEAESQPTLEEVRANVTKLAEEAAAEAGARVRADAERSEPERARLVQELNQEEGARPEEVGRQEEHLEGQVGREVSQPRWQRTRKRQSQRAGF